MLGVANGGSSTMRRKQLLVGMLLVVLLLAACGGEQRPDQALTLHAQDISFDVKEFTVQTGVPVALTYINQGTIDHAFKIDGLVADQKVRPGQTIVLRFTPKKPGTYTFVCAIPGHELAGMVGTLIVEPADS
jgi:uncharacterized cupredoxin-like copper-binding protein